MKLALLFPLHLREAMQVLDTLEDLEEIRVRIGQPLFVYGKCRELLLVKSAGHFLFRESTKRSSCEENCGETTKSWDCESLYRVTEKDLREMQNYISNYSLYAYKEELKNGFITIEGGHRIGVAGAVINKDGKVSGISHLTFFNIRVAHEKKGCAKSVLGYLRQEETIYNTLLVSAPGAGKTTLLRDCIRSLSYGECGMAGNKIAVVDERSELAASFHGIPQNDVGPRTDVLDGCNKPEGIMMLLRTMSPQIIAVDELGGEADFYAVEQAAYCGCRILGTIHAGSIADLKEKAISKKWCERDVFERFVFVKKEADGNRSFHVYNQKWECLC